MTKPNILSICLLAALLAPLAGCQTPPPHAESQAHDRAVQAHDNVVQAPDRTVQADRHEAAPRESAAQRADHKARVRDRHDEAGVAFSTTDVAFIRDYYQHGHQPGPTAGRITKLQRGETYPFGYTWRDLPSDLETRLSPLPKGYIRVLVGSEVGILDIRNRVVADVLDDLAGGSQDEAREPHHADTAAFSTVDIEHVRDYYRQGHRPGLTAGRITKLRRGEPYPFGYTWRALPSDLEARLSPLPRGYVRVIVGSDIGILDIRTRVVVDLIEDLTA